MVTAATVSATRRPPPPPPRPRSAPRPGPPAYASTSLFTVEDRDEARSRLERLAQVWRVRLRSLDDDQLDRRDGDAPTIREVASHLAESTYYADAVGELS